MQFTQISIVIVIVRCLISVIRPNFPFDSVISVFIFYSLPIWYVRHGLLEGVSMQKWRILQYREWYVPQRLCRWLFGQVVSNANTILSRCSGHSIQEPYCYNIKVGPLER